MKRRRQSFEASAFLEVGPPIGVKGIRIRLDFQMAPNPDISSRGKPMPDYFPLRGSFAAIDRKGPRPSPNVMPVLLRRRDQQLAAAFAKILASTSPRTRP
jgi:hypothetical protein